MNHIEMLGLTIAVFSCCSGGLLLAFCVFNSRRPTALRDVGKLLVIYAFQALSYWASMMFLFAVPLKSMLNFFIEPLVVTILAFGTVRLRFTLAVVTGIAITAIVAVYFPNVAPGTQ